MAKENLAQKALEKKPDWTLALEVAGGIIAGTITTAMANALLASRPKAALFFNLIVGGSAAAWGKPTILKVAGATHVANAAAQGFRQLAPGVSVPGLSGLSGRRRLRGLKGAGVNNTPVVSEERTFGMYGTVNDPRLSTSFSFY